MLSLSTGTTFDGPQQRHAMRLATFNMRSGGSHAHWDELLTATSPDIVLAQEARDPSSLPPDLLGIDDLQRAVWAPVSHGRWGSAILVRGGTVEARQVEQFEGWVVGGLVRTNDREFYCFSVHLPPLKSSYIAAAHAMLDRLQSVVDGAPVVLGGDWNLTTGPRHPTEEMTNRKGESELHQRH